MRTGWLAIISMVSLLAWPAPVIAQDGRGRGNGQGNGQGTAKVERSERAEKQKAKPGKPEDGRSRAVATRGVATPRKAAPPVAEQAVVIDRDGHRRIVTQYYSRESLPPGLAKRQSLPPGLQKQLRERGQLPPGLQKRLVPVPLPLVSQFPALPPYYNRYFAGRDLIIVDGRTNAIVAVISDVLVPRR